MLTAVVAAIILIVTLAFWRARVLTAFCHFVCILLAGIVAFNYWEPLADVLEPSWRLNSVAGFEDFFCLVGIFIVTLVILRAIVNLFNTATMEYHPLVDHLGGAFFGFISGYLLSGFLVCAMQTLPWHENFLGFPEEAQAQSVVRGWMPPDHAWLAVMRQAGVAPFSRPLNPVPDGDLPYGPYRTFDPHETFEKRYRYFRRHGDNRPALPAPIQR